MIINNRLKININISLNEYEQLKKNDLVEKKLLFQIYIANNNLNCGIELNFCTFLKKELNSIFFSFIC